MQDKEKITEKELEELFTKHLKDQYNIGLRTGIKVASQIILDTLENKNKKFSERLSSVKHFCKVAISNEKFISGESEAL